MINSSCNVLIEETAHLFAEVIRKNTKEPSSIGMINENLTLTLNAVKKKETYEGVFIFNSKTGVLKTNSTGFLKDNPILYIGSVNNYAIATSFGLLYMHLKYDKVLKGDIYSYYNRLDKNPKNEIPLATLNSNK